MCIVLEQHISLCSLFWALFRNSFYLLGKGTITIAHINARNEKRKWFTYWSVNTLKCKNFLVGSLYAFGNLKKKKFTFENANFFTFYSNGPKNYVAWVFFFYKYGKFWSISPEQKVDFKPLFSEEYQVKSDANCLQSLNQLSTFRYDT